MRAARCARASSGGPVDRRGPRPSVTVGFEARCRRHGGGLLGLGLGLLCPVLAGPPGGHLLCGHPIVLAAPLLGELHRVSRTLGECALMDPAPGKRTSAASLAQSATVMRRCAVLGFQTSGSSGVSTSRTPGATSRPPAPPAETMASWPEASGASGATGAVGATPGPWVCLITSRRRCTSIRGTRACPRGRPPARARSAWSHRRAPQGLRRARG